MPISSRGFRSISKIESSADEGRDWRPFDMLGGLGESRATLDFELRGAETPAGPDGAVVGNLTPGLGTGATGGGDVVLAPTAPGPGIMVPTSLLPATPNAGVAIIGYNTGQNNEAPAQAATLDKLHFVLLGPVGSGTQIFITDRSWNGSAFAAAAGDGTLTWTAGADLAAGTVVTATLSGGNVTFTVNGVTTAPVSAGGFDIDHSSGDAIYMYQGAINAPTSFLYAGEFADGNTTFGGSLVNTGLTAGLNAIAIAGDSGAYNGPTTHAENFLWNGAGSTILHAIADSTNWVIDDSTGDNAREQEVQNGPWFTHADVDFWGTMGAGGLANTLRDSTHQSGNDDYNHTRQYDGLLFPVGHPQAGQNVFVSLRDIVFDTVDGKFFVTDSNISGVNRILQGNIADLIANPTSVPTLTVLFSYTQAAGDPTDLSGRLDNLELDLANNIVYFTKGDDLYKVNYDTANQAGTLLFQANVDAASSPSGVGNPAGSTNNFFNDMVIDFDSGTIYISSTRVVTAASDQIQKNFIYQLTGLTTGSGTNAFTFNASNTGTARLLPFVQNDDAYNPGGSNANSPSSAANAAFFFAQEFGSLDGLAIDPVNNILYFSTGEILFDHDLNGGTPVQYIGGIVGSYALTGNPTGVHTVLYQQTAQFGGAIPGLMGDLEVDLQNGHFYVLDYAGINGVNDDNHWYRMNLNGSGIIQFTQTIGDPDGAATVGLTLNHAPTLTGSAAGGLAVTEASSAPNSGETARVTLFTGITIADVDTTTADEITGAVIRIGDGLTFEAASTAGGHAATVDFLRINNLTSGTIAGSGINFTYNSATGAMVLTGAATVAEYKAAIELVQFSTSGDNVTNNGNSATRTIYVSVSDGLTMSDEVSATVTVTGINDAPVNTVGGAMSFTEDTIGTAGAPTPPPVPRNAITGISIADADADATTELFTMTLSVAHGTLNIRTDVTGGLAAGDVTGNGTNQLVLTGTQNQINATLAAVNNVSGANGLVYTPSADFNGADTLTIVTNDQGNNGNDPGNSGTGTTEADTDTKTINITNVNDAPTVTDSTQEATTILEDTPLPAGQTISSLFTASFSDALDQQQVPVTNPTGSVANTLAGIAIVANDISGTTGRWQYFNGTWQDIPGASLGSAFLLPATTAIRFNPVLNYNGPAPTLTVHLVDSSGGAIAAGGEAANLSGVGATGGTTRYSTGTVTLSQTITAVNDAPVNTVGATLTLPEDSGATAVTGMSISDVDANPATDIFTVTLDVLHGTLNVLAGAPGGLVAGDIAGNGSATVTLTGTINQINATLAAAGGVTYTPTGDYNGSDRVQITTNDGGATGLDPGGPSPTSEQDVDSKTINVTAVNDPVTGTAPASATPDEDSTNFAISGMSISDIDATLAPAGVYVVTLSSTNGTMTLTTLTGLTFSAGDGTADATMTFRGTLADINTALATASYTPTAHYNGSATITLAVTDTFGGIVATGTGAATNDSDVINVTVSAVNDPVTTNAPPTATIDEDAVNAAITGLSISDVDATLAPAGVYEVTLSATQGALSLTTLAGLTFTAGDGTGDSTMTFHGTLADINTALATATYTPPANYNGPAQITLSATDTYGGIVATGTGAATIDSDVINVTVTAVNDTPVVSLAATGSSTEQVAGTVDATATISDVDLDALNGGNGNYSGATLTIANNAGNDANDLFAIGTSGAFTVNGSNLEAPGGLVFATFSGGNGTPLVVSFTSSGTAATTALVNAVAQSIQYTYTGDNPPVAGIDIAISLNDGAPVNAGQGSIAGHPAVGTDIIHLSITDTPENQPPVVDLNGTDGGNDFASAYTEDGTAAVIADTDVSITDPDVGDDITGATITITDAIAGDQLTVVGVLPGSIVATGGGTATITLSGIGTHAEYQQALTQIRYSSTSNDPTAGGTDLTRSVTVTVNDGNDPSAAATTIVTVSGSNDPPAGTDATIVLNEDTPRLLAQADFGFTDPDSADAFSAVTITGVTGGTLYYDADGTGGAGLPVAVGSFPQTYSAAELAAGNVSFQANSNLNGTGVAMLTFQVIDNSGAVNNTDPSANTLTFNVSPGNDAPTLSAPTSATVTFTENAQETALFGGTTVTDIDAPANFSGGGLTLTIDGTGGGLVFVTGSRFSAQGVDPFDLFDSVTAQVIGKITGIGTQTITVTAFNAGATDAVVDALVQAFGVIYVGDDPVGGTRTATLTFNDGGNTGGGALTGQQTQIVDVLPVNDAPSGTNATIIMNEGGSRVLAAADFGFSDTADNDGFAGIVLTTLPTAGILVFDSDGPGGLPGVLASQGQFVTAAQLALGALTYFPGGNGNGDDYATFTFQVRDDGGTANSGQDTDQSANTITFDVNPVNDAPSGTDNIVTGSEDDPYVFTLADFGFSDVVEGDDFAGVIFTTVPTTGTLFYDADGPGGAAPVALADGAGPIAAADIAAGKVYFVPVADAFGSPYASFTFQVQDDGGITNGGVDTDQSPNTMTINIAPDNLPPAVDLDGATGGVNYTTIFVEDGAGVAIGSGVTVTDPDSGIGDMIESATITLTDRVAGDALTISGALPPGIVAVTTPTAGAITIQITGTGTGAQYQALIESILYSTTSQDPTVGGTDLARTITVTVNDGFVDSAVATTTVNITASDDAPVAQPDAFTIDEATVLVAANLFANNGSGPDTDPDGPPLAISAVNGSGANVGTQIILASGALLTVYANGTFDYDTNHAFDPTPTPGSGASNQPASDSFTYTLAGGNTVTVTLTINGLDTDDLLLGTAGSDFLIAGVGDDTLVGGASNDQMDGGSGTDTALFAGDLTSFADSALGWVVSSAEGNDVLQNVEIAIEGGGQRNLLVGATGFAGLQAALNAAEDGDNVRLATGTYTGTFSYDDEDLTVIAQPNAQINATFTPTGTQGIAISGANLADTITTGAGDDLIDGGGGSDAMSGGAGDDVYYVDVLGDSVTELSGEGRDVVYAYGTFGLVAGSHVEVLSAASLVGTAPLGLYGNELAQEILGNAGANVIRGGGGADALLGLGGNDEYYIGDAAERVIEAGGGGRDVIYASVDYVLGAGSSVEVLSTDSLIGTSAIDLTGNELAQEVFGNAGDNILDGGDGSDYLFGGSGADTFAFTTALGSGNVDAIADFSVADDVIALDDAVFTALTPGALAAGAFVTGTSAQDADDRIIYDAATGQLYYDADGNGSGAQVLFATLNANLSLTASDFTVI